jgi:hypothetical protein
MNEAAMAIPKLTETSLETSRFSRRSALRGLGAGAVLMSSVLRSVRVEAAPANLRMMFFFHANGSHYAWTPTGMGEAFTLSQHLAPLEPVRKDIVILRNLTLPRGTGNAHKMSTLSALGAGSTTSFDQVLANAIKGNSPLASLELAIGFTGGGGGKVPSLSQVSGTFIPADKNPVAAYQRIVARISPAPMTGDTAAAERALKARRSVLDYLNADATRFRGRLGADERPKMDLYFESLREVEKGIGNFATGLGAAPGCAKPGALPADALNYEAHATDFPKVDRLFLDLMALTNACGLTRVMSMMWGGGENGEDVDFMGIHDWHITTHGNPNGAPGQKIIAMQAYLAGEYAYLIQKLKSYGEGPGSPFDSTLTLWGTQNGNTNQTNFAKEDHDRHNTPFILSGRAGGALKTGRMMDCGGVNHPDLYVSIARQFGLPIEKFGDPALGWCSGPLPGVFT